MGNQIHHCIVYGVALLKDAKIVNVNRIKTMVEEAFLYVKNGEMILYHFIIGL